MTALSLWTRLGAVWLVALGLLVVAAPAARASSWDPAAGAAAGLGAGAALFVCLGGLHAWRPAPPHGITALVLVVTAGAEEAIWRWFALGELAPRVGAVSALAATALGFALAHRHGVGQHLLTGAVFGAVYLATGSLLAAWLAHAAYNLCVAAARAGATS